MTAYWKTAVKKKPVASVGMVNSSSGVVAPSISPPLSRTASVARITTASVATLPRAVHHHTTSLSSFIITIIIIPYEEWIINISFLLLLQDIVASGSSSNMSANERRMMMSRAPLSSSSLPSSTSQVSSSIPGSFLATAAPGRAAANGTIITSSSPSISGAYGHHGHARTMSVTSSHSEDVSPNSSPATSLSSSIMNPSPLAAVVYHIIYIISIIVMFVTCISDIDE